MSIMVEQIADVSIWADGQLPLASLPWHASSCSVEARDFVFVTTPMRSYVQQRHITGHTSDNMTDNLTSRAAEEWRCIGGITGREVGQPGSGRQREGASATPPNQTSRVFG
ncbi:hypothetical protein E8E13_000135 [Curvularia kusanoi]|uniref:Uncharacterized protein n=1 Tax=Curvularia kusanoi TaxID=90978 RepID=A0A9P4T6C3_CURKU|nr:hypothetical protein E8E13_000135 [Curvularia kusanoi]